MLPGSLHPFQSPDIPVTNIKRYHTKNTKRTIDELPVERDVPYRPGNKCKRKHHYAGYHPELDDPDIAYRIFQRANECQRYYQMTKCQPVGCHRLNMDNICWWFARHYKLPLSTALTRAVISRSYLKGNQVQFQSGTQ